MGYDNTKIKYNKNDYLKKPFEYNPKKIISENILIQEYKQKIEELLQEIKDLKEEIEMLKAVNQEC